MLQAFCFTVFLAIEDTNDCVRLQVLEGVPWKEIGNEAALQMLKKTVRMSTEKGDRACRTHIRPHASMYMHLCYSDSQIHVGNSGQARAAHQRHKLRRQAQEAAQEDQERPGASLKWYREFRGPRLIRFAQHPRHLFVAPNLAGHEAIADCPPKAGIGLDSFEG